MCLDRSLQHFYFTDLASALARETLLIGRKTIPLFPTMTR